MNNSKTLCFGFLLIVTLSVQIRCVAQDLIEGAKFWTGATVTYNLTDKVNIEYEHFHSLELRDGRTSFSQSKITGTYKFNKHFNLKMGYSHLSLPWSQGQNSFSYKPNIFGTRSQHKFLLDVIHRFRISDQFRFKQRLVTEYFTPQVKKFRVRFEYRLKMYYRNSKLPFGITPFLETTLAHYQGGMLVPYNQEGQVQYLAPNGLHRVRFKIGAKFKPVEKWKNLKLILFYMRQNEINTSFLGRDINLLSSNGETLLPFNSYHVAGIHLLYTIKKE